MRLARVYLGLQAVAGAAWWIAVWISTDVRRWTLGGLEPRWLVVPDLVLFAGASALAAYTGRRAALAVAASWTIVVTVGLAVYATVERQAGWGAVLMTLATIGTTVAVLTLWLGRFPARWIFVGPFAFRPARAGTRARHLRRSLAQLVIFWSAFLVALPLGLGWIERRWRIRWPFLDDGSWPAGVALFGAGSAFGLWSCVAMAVHGDGTPLPAETARRLVIVGPYRFVRNPMAVAGAAQTVGIGVWTGSWMVVASAVAGGLVWNEWIRPGEEADLRSRFGAAYDVYRSEVRCWVPTFGARRSAVP